MDGEIMRWIVEARIEQELSKPTIFAIRFADDLCNGDFEVANKDELKPNTLIGVFVRAGNTYSCLVHGPITQIRSSSRSGGTGSWIEVRGQDRRIEMDRVAVQATWPPGKASDAARHLLAAYKLTADCEETRKQYSDGTNALNQRGTDLAFLTDIARKNNLEFWISYKVAGTPDAFAVTPTGNVKSSPPRGAASSGAPPLLSPPVLTPDAGLTITVQPPNGHCTTVTKFDTHIDFERPNAAKGFAQSVTDGAIQIQNATPPDATLGDGRKDIVTVDGVKREALTAPVTDPDEQPLAQQALLTEAAWFVDVECSSTLDLLGFAAEPHQIIDVQYAGPRLSGPYQVKKAVHVINAADHFIDFQMRANGLRSAGAT
jgi:hypothetical protein